GGQFQKNGASTMTTNKDWSEVNFDVLGEFKLGGGGWVTGEGAYYHFATAADNAPAAKDTFFLLAAWASPVGGFGNIQPMVRYQWASTVGVMGAATNTAWNLDVGLSYLIKGPALRFIATYGHT